MATHAPTYNPYDKGHSTNRYHLFNGSDFAYWNAQMRVYFQAINFDLWHVVTNGPHTTIIVVNGIQTPKPIQEYNENDKKLAFMNVKAMNILYCALERNEFNHIPTCINAHDI